MSEFDNLKDDAQKLAQDHPEQVEKGEQAVEDKLGLRQHGDAAQQAGGAQATDDQATDDQGSAQQGSAQQSTASDQDQGNADPGQ
jgi:hypothetical protein